MITKNEIQEVKDTLTDKITNLRGYATNKDTQQSELHGTIIRIQHLTSALTKIEMMGDK